MAISQHQLTNDDISRIAELIKIYIPDEQLDDFRSQLSTALDSSGVFDELDLDDVEETSSSVGTINVFREDISSTSLSQEDANQNAAFVQDGFMVVQRVVQK